MTRWIQEFNQHPFNHVWKDLLAAVKSVVVDDVTVATTVQELARLKKPYSSLMAYLVVPTLSSHPSQYGQAVIAKQMHV
ncbi:hypothetical protein [Pseudomonas sp. SCA2728.1_7]|uniref:hypothetical protein n=1 Tax=Pseudomonas sp. SCA2728.1_7 TaxID=2825975 RepID=UPI001BB00C4A|nr:hypothetical protein [Pseudomonas sp. SCA2728.1_7]QUE92028.1 hypothetical protein KBP52_06255 [Pseudomonas sp. SCA2728.1_7]